MHTGKRYTLKEFLAWTKSDIYIMAILSGGSALLYEVLNIKWLALPWVLIALIGTATAFIIGFRNTQTYNRLWEARQIYGAILNSSRSWGMMVKDFIGTTDTAELREIRKQLVYRHIAWLTALRYQLRETREWETARVKPSNLEYGKKFRVDEWHTDFKDTIARYLSAEELNAIMAKKNRAAQLIGLQSKHLKELKLQKQIEPLDYVEMEKLLVDLYDLQGRCERIKNFPYPRQFATISQMLTHLFAVLVPFGVLNEFHRLGGWMVWLSVPFGATVGWIFLTMERIGENTENPFEGGANDVPITTITRTIEIDLMELLDLDDIPPAITPVNYILT